MVDVAAFEEKPAHEVRVGERLWVLGEARLVKAVEPGRFKSTLLFRFHGQEPVERHRFATVKVTGA